MSISALSASRFANPMTSGVGSARPLYYKSLSDSEIAALTASEIGDMQSADMAALSSNQIAAFNPQELSAGLETYLGNMQVLPANFIARLSGAQIGQFSASLVSATLPQMSSAQINAFTQEQVHGLSTSQIAGLGVQKTAVLSATWLNKLSSTQLQGMGTSFVKALTKTQIAGLDATRVQYLSEAQVASLSKVQLGALNSGQIAAIDATDIKAMSTVQFATLTKTQLQALTVGQIGQVDGFKIRTVSAKNLASLSYQQIQAFTTKAVSSLDGNQIASLTKDQISRGFDAAKIGALSASRVRFLNSGQIGAMTNAEVDALSLNTMKALYDRHLNAFTVPQLSSLSEEKIDWLISKKLNTGFTAQQKDAIFARKAFFADAAPTVATIIADQSVVKGVDFSFTVPLDTFADADSGDVLSYEATLADDASLPSWLQFDAKTLTFSGAPDDASLGVLHLKVTATDRAMKSVSSAFKITVAGNYAPTGSVTILGSATPKQGEDLTAANTLADADGLGTISYQWMANGSKITGANGNTLTITPYHVGKAISVKASYTDGHGIAESAISQATRINAPPTGSVTITGTPKQGQVLTAGNNLADADRLGTSISYQWMADGSDISDATNNTLTLAQAHLGKAISVKASYTDRYGTAESVTSASTRINAPPTGSVTITGSGSGTPTQNQILTASNTLADIDGVDTAISYQWMANGSNISGATGNTFTPTQEQVGKAISVKASYIDALGTAEGLNSTATALVINVNDAPNVANAIGNQSATEGVAFTFTVPSNTFVDVDKADALSYTATRGDGSALPSWLQFNASTLTFSGTPGDANPGELNLKVTAMDLVGASVSSAFKITVANVNDVPTGGVSISGTPTQGNVLTAGNSLADVDGLGTISYQWLANGSNISGATNSSLTLTQAHVGKAISVKASYTDVLGTAESKTSAATALVANVNDASTGSVSITGTPTQGQTLTAGNSLADADGLGTISYQWLADGSNISGATTNSLSLTQAHVGKAISVKASYTDVLGTAESKTSAATTLVANANDAPTGNVSITGLAKQGIELIAANTLEDADGVVGTISYQWMANGINIAQATESTFTPTQTQVGKAISVKASYTDALGTAESKTSIATALVVNVNDEPTLGTTIDDQSATESVAFSFLVPAETFEDIDGANTLSYSATLADGSALPSWLNFDAENRTFTGTPGNWDLGELNLKVTATDNLASVSTTFMVTVGANSPELTKEWTKLLGTGAGDQANALAAAADGSIYVSGFTSGSLDENTKSGGVDAFITKFNSDGTKAWTQLLGSISTDYARAMTTGADGSVYISGSTNGSLGAETNSGGYDAFIAKFSPDGDMEWTQLLGTSDDDSARALTTGADGSIYVSGYTKGDLDTASNGQTNSGGYDAFITKFDADGTKAWTELLGTTSEDRATALAAGADGSIYVSGYTSGDLDAESNGQTNSGSKDAFITKFNSDGTKAWTQLLGASGDDRAQALATDSDGNIYVSGYTDGDLDGQSNNGYADAFVAKFDSYGTKEWTRLLGTGTYDEARAITTGADGSIYVSGYTRESSDSDNHDAFITKIGSDGATEWTKLLATSGDDAANALVTAADGSIYVSGSTTGSPDGQTNSGGVDAFITKYSL